MQVYYLNVHYLIFILCRSVCDYPQMFVFTFFGHITMTNEKYDEIYLIMVASVSCERKIDSLIAVVFFYSRFVHRDAISTTKCLQTQYQVGPLILRLSSSFNNLILPFNESTQ